MSRSSTSRRAEGHEAADGGAATLAETAGRTGKARRRDMSGSEEAGRRAAREALRGKRSFFEIYKPGQGRYTRMGTAIGGGVLIAGAGHFLFTQLEAQQSDALWTLLVRLLVPLLVVVGLGLTLYWIVAVNRTSCDFFIATEGEMKKVSWSTRNEIVGSTKVVIACTLLLGLLLFVVDYAFMWFFRWIGVLWSGSA